MGYDRLVGGALTRRTVGRIGVFTACSVLLTRVIVGCGDSEGPPSSRELQADAGLSDSRPAETDGEVPDVVAKDAALDAPIEMCPDASAPSTCPGVDADSDNNNCGGCGVICSAPAPSVAQCTAGRCLVTLAAGLNGPHQIALDQTHVYWNGHYDADQPTTIAKVPRVGGSVTTLVSGYVFDGAGDIQQPSGLAVDSTGVYWTNIAGPMTNGSVKKVGLNGGAVSTLVSGLGGIGRLVVDSQNAYWSDLGGGSLGSVALKGGPIVSIAVGQKEPIGIALDPTSVYWVNAANIGGGLNGSVMKAPLGGVPDGGSPIVLASGQNVPTSVAVDATTIVWANGSRGGKGGSVMSAPLGGGPPAILATGGQPSFIALDCASVYWTDSSNGTVMKVPRGGGAVTLLATGVSPTGIGVDQTSIYWADYVAGTVNKLTPK